MVLGSALGWCVGFSGGGSAAGVFGFEPRWVGRQVRLTQVLSQRGGPVLSAARVELGTGVVVVARMGDASLSRAASVLRVEAGVRPAPSVVVSMYGVCGRGRPGRRSRGWQGVCRRGQ